MNGRALAAGGWRSDALSSTLLAALLHAEHGRLDDARGPARRRRPGGARGARRRPGAARPGRRDARRAQRRPGRGPAGGHGRSARRRRGAGRRSGRSRRASHAAHHGAELIELGARLAIEDRRPRELLHRIEAMRTMVWRAPLVRAPDDAAMAALLAELRRLERRGRRSRTPIPTPAAAPTASGCASSGRSATLSRRARGQRGEATTTEDAVAEAIGHARRPRAPRLRQPRRPAVGGRRAAAGGRRCTTSADVAALDEHLEVVRVRPAPAQPGAGLGGVARRGRASCSTRPRRRSPTSCCRRPSPARDRPLVVVPTGVLHGVPWTRARRRCAAGRCRSARRSARGRRRPGGGRARAVRGASGRRRSSPARRCASPTPRSSRWPRRTSGRPSCRPPTSTRRRRRRACSAPSELVHLACHGSFRTDNPLFSTLSLADGPLTVYDLERARGDARGRRAVGVQRRDVGGDQRRHAARAVQRARRVRGVGRHRRSPTSSPPSLGRCVSSRASPR